LVEVVFLGEEEDQSAEPVQLEEALVPSFVALDELDSADVRPPIVGYIRGFARDRAARGDPGLATAAWLGNLWRPEDDA
jgi:hypothetical protein